MNSPHESKLYHGLSFAYDGIFAPLLRARIHSTIRSLEIPPGARVLELGVGTGLSLPAYPKHAIIEAIDVSEPMLLRAARTVRRQNWNHIVLRKMDAMNLEFADESFDYVMAFHVLSVVKDYHRLLREMARVGKRGAHIVIINHLRTNVRWTARLLDAFSPLTQRFGWQTQLTYENVMSSAPLQVVRRFKTSPHSLFMVIIAKPITRSKSAPPAHTNPIPNCLRHESRSPSSLDYSSHK